MHAPFWVTYGLLWALVLFQGVVVLGLTHTAYGRRANGAGSPGEEGADDSLRGRLVPPFTATDLAGRKVDSAVFLDRTTAVLFVSPSCSSCAATLDEMAALVTKTNGNVIVICRSSPDRCRRLAEKYDVDVSVVADTEFRISKLFGVTRVPTAVLVNDEGIVDSFGHPRRGEELIEILDVEGDLPPGEATPELISADEGR